MARKIRKIITKEIYEIVNRLLRDESKTIKEIAETVDLSPKTVTNISKTLEFEFGNYESLNESKKKKALLKRDVVKPIDLVINNFIACNNDITLKEIKEELFKKMEVSLSISSISRKLKKLGITRKRLSLIPEERNSLEKIDQRAIYAAEVSKYTISNLVFLDETGFNLHTSRKYGYSSKNTKAYKTVSANKGKNLSCLCVISYDGLVAYEKRSGRYNSSFFIEFIYEYLIQYFKENPQKILVMDNASFHHSKDVLKELRECGINFKFFPPYSPQLNPIEEFFSMVKARYSSLRNNNNALECNLDLIFNCDFSLECRNFYENMNKWVEKANLNVCPYHRIELVVQDFKIGFVLSFIFILSYAVDHSEARFHGILYLFRERCRILIKVFPSLRMADYNVLDSLLL